MLKECMKNNIGMSHFLTIKEHLDKVGASSSGKKKTNNVQFFKKG